MLEIWKIYWKIGEWVIVIYDQWYPGIVLKIDLQHNVLVTKFLSRNKKRFSWPKSGYPNGFTGAGV